MPTSNNSHSPIAPCRRHERTEVDQQSTNTTNAGLKPGREENRLLTTSIQKLPTTTMFQVPWRAIG